MLQVSERAASVICQLTEPGYTPDSAGLRVAAGDPPALSIAPDARAGDIVLEANGARVFADPEAVPRVADRQLDVQVDANGAVDFAFVPARERPRSAADVLDHHVHCRRAGDLEADLHDNYHPLVRLLSAEGVHHGHDGVRALAAVLRTYLPAGDYRYRQVQVSGDVGLLVWSGRCGSTDAAVHDGVDSYVIREGRIVAQTIHYSASSMDDHPHAGMRRRRLRERGSRS